MIHYLDPDGETRRYGRFYETHRFGKGVIGLDDKKGSPGVSFSTYIAISDRCYRAKSPTGARVEYRKTCSRHYFTVVDDHGYKHRLDFPRGASQYPSDFDNIAKTFLTQALAEDLLAVMELEEGSFRNG